MVEDLSVFGLFSLKTCERLRLGLTNTLMFLSVTRPSKPPLTLGALRVSKPKQQAELPFKGVRGAHARNASRTTSHTTMC